MTQDKASHRRALMRAVSILGISLGMAGVATAAEIGSQSSGGGAGKVIANQHKADDLGHSSAQVKLDSAQVKGESHQWKQDSHQLKGESHQLKLDSNQIKQSNQHKQSPGVTHGLNPQPEPPG